MRVAYTKDRQHHYGEPKAFMNERNATKLPYHVQEANLKVDKHNCVVLNEYIYR